MKILLRIDSNITVLTIVQILGIGLLSFVHAFPQNINHQLRQAEEWHMRNPDSSIHYCNQVLQNYPEDLEDSLVAKAWFIKGWNLFLKNEYGKAISSFQQLNDHINEGDMIFIRSVGRIGVSYKELGVFDSALVYLQRYDALVDKYIGETAIEAKLELGEFYRAMQRMETSNTYKLEAIRRARSGNNRGNKIMALYYYLDDNINDVAKPEFQEYLNEYLQLTEKFHEDGTPDDTHSGMLLISLKEDNKIHILEADISILEKKGPTRGYLFLNRHLVREYVKRKKYNLAEIQARKGWQSAVKIFDKAYQLEYLLLRSEIADSTKDFQASKQWLNSYYLLKDSLLKADLLSRVDSLNIRYAASQKDRVITDQALVIQKKTHQKNLLLGGIFLILFVGTTLGLIIRNRYRLADKLALQESVLQKQRIKQLENEKKMLAMSSMIEGQEAERMRIAQDLHDGLGGLLSTVKAHFNTVQHEIDRLESINFYKKVNGLIDTASAEVRRISHNMAPYALQLYGLKDALEDLCKQTETQNLEIQFEWLGGHDRLAETTEVMLFRIVQELLHNAAKYAQANNILVQVIRYDKEISLIIEDDGKGFNYRKALEKEGIGLKSVQSRIEYLEGNLDVNSIIGEGTTYSIQVGIR